MALLKAACAKTGDRPIWAGMQRATVVEQTSSRVKPTDFRTGLDGNQCALITADLTKLDAKLKVLGTQGDAIALQRANFFAERRLWSDAMQ